MNITDVVDGVGQPAGEVLVALLGVMLTMTSQPGFDKYDFHQKITAHLQNDRTSDLQRTIFELFLQR